ncbi:MAG: nodulation protein NfeD [Parachlamydiales bacterium]
MRWFLTLLTLLLPLAADPAEVPSKVGYIAVGREGITKSTLIKVRAALNHYKREKPSFVILQLNTPGGEVFVSQEISDALRELDSRYGIPVVAFIDNWALSAGAMLAYSCRYIATAQDGLMGAALPILINQEGGVQAASEKIRSVVRADFASRAEFFGRSPAIAEAMVDPDLIVVKRGGEIIALNSESEIEKGDEVISAKDKLLTLKAQEMIDLGVANFLVHTTVRAEPTHHPYPLADSPLSEIPLFKEMADATVIPYKPTWKEGFFSILTLPIVSSLLFLGLILGFYIEINTPGFGVAGTVALVCLFFIILSSFALQAMNWFEVGLLGLGLLLLALELFVIPGFGITGILGILFTIVALVAMLLPNIGKVHWDFDMGQFNAAGEEFLVRLAWIGGAVVVGVLLMFLLSRFVLPRFSRFSHLVLKGEQETSKGYVSGIEAERLPPVGTVGRAASPLRPSGKVAIGEELYDATTRGGYIAKGAQVVVVERGRAHLIVEEKT